MGVFAEPPGLGERGSSLFRALIKGVTDYGRYALLVEAARMADRLDELDNIIQGKGVLNLMQFRVLDKEINPDHEELNINVEVKFQNVLSEARQQQNTFRQMITDLSRGGEAKTDEAPAPAAAAETTVDDELEAAGGLGR
ncbi:hypothetical protein [Arthrobacter sp. JCM 19049]|uniref:hypothetical protein n=1 Tax=Arthrobacter sp. JCM 19049 TaxID=1460643 RepID=UPI0006D1F889|nr:hypothetical protein [Arthrobacter sp. JCM 19049]